MNHVDALKICRDALESVSAVACKSDGIAGWHKNGDIASWESALPEVDASLAATAVIEPVAASIESLTFRNLQIEASTAKAGEPAMRAYSAITHHVDQHCAAQVAQEHESVWVDAGREIDRIAKERDEARAQLADQTDARNLAITERIEITKYCDDLRDQLAQALAAKPELAKLCKLSIPVIPMPNPGRAK